MDRNKEGYYRTSLFGATESQSTYLITNTIHEDIQQIGYYMEFEENIIT